MHSATDVFIGRGYRAFVKQKRREERKEKSRGGGRSEVDIYTATTSNNLLEHAIG